MALSRMLKLNEICCKKNLLIQHNRSFRKLNTNNKRRRFESLASPFENVGTDTSNINGRRLWKPFAFTVVFTTASFGSAAIWQYENMRSHATRMLKQPMGYMYRKSQDGSRKAGEFRNQFNSWWNRLSEGEKVFAPICLLNVLVFVAWRVPRWHPFMMQYFCSNPGGRSVCLPMLLSTFSHYSGFHLFANMYVLHSFSSGAVAALGKEQFLALYLSAGVFSSLTSYIYKIVMKQPGLSLGASGAIMAILGYVCTQYPETRLGIIFIPFLTFSAGSAIKAIVGLDFLGVVLGWRIFDHAAHLGGAAWGIAWSYWGNQHIWHNREPMLQHWHKFRGSINK